ncbi:MAG: tRNA (guanosine(46)-N7)-methyltransferase TrmB [Sphaerochaetaceae bacterium]|nr:tRNA (guanosine(46)-N7)-methyltransferase TrmB [Sphaerochaetaceae bacterium]
MENEIFDLIPSLEKVEKRDKGDYKQVKSFALRGQKLRDYQINALKNHFHEYCIEFDENKKLDFTQIFGNSNPVIIEIGFGMGYTTEQIALEHPDVNYLGIEVFLYGFSKLLAHASEKNIKNLRLMRFDAKEVLQDMVKDSSVDGFHIFFPDPWPKKRHHKKRLIQEDFAALLCSKLKKGGYIYCATDWQEYADQMLEVFNNTEGIKNPYDGFATHVKWRPETGFERKGLDAQRSISEVWFEKVTE